MHQFVHPHYGEVTSNPVEVSNNVMNHTQGFEHSIRSSPLFCRYRQLIDWSFKQIEKREHSLYPVGKKVSVFSHSVTPVFCPYVVRVLEHHIHYYMMNKNKFEIKSKCSTKGIRDQRNHEYIIEDIPYQETYHVNLNTGDCDCHYGYWKGIPCIHILMVLWERGEVNRSFTYVDKVYLEEKVAKTCRKLNEKEKEFLNWLRNLTGDDAGEDTIGLPVRMDMVKTRRGIRRNSSRIASKGEYTGSEGKKSKGLIIKEIVYTVCY